MFILLYRVSMVVCVEAHHQSNLLIDRRIVAVLLSSLADTPSRITFFSKRNMGILEVTYLTIRSITLEPRSIHHSC
jgi:hypothetical protein